MPNLWFRRDGTPYPGQGTNNLDFYNEVEKDLNNLALRRVAETTLPDGRWVSTVWLGLNQSWNSERPMIFETMVFPGKDQPRSMDLETYRYATEAEALAGHEAVVRRLSVQV